MEDVIEELRKVKPAKPPRSTSPTYDVRKKPK